MCKPEFTAANRQKSSELLLTIAETVSTAHPLDRSLLVDLSTYAPGCYLVKTDRTSMRHSLEVRCPLLDHELVAFALRMPARDKLGLFSGKKALKKVFANFLPQHLFTLPKKGFSVPLGLWMKHGKFDGLIHDMLGKNTIEKRGIFNPSYIDEIVQQHKNGKVDHGRRLWTLLILEEWMRKFLP
jgi:asparagine synthase (glutamine-hydrolysing)